MDIKTTATKIFLQWSNSNGKELSFQPVLFTYELLRTEQTFVWNIFEVVSSLKSSVKNDLFLAPARKNRP